MHIDLVFPLRGESLPSDHGYDLYAAMSRLVPRVHDPEAPIRIANIRGDSLGKGMLRLDPERARLRLRLPTDEIPTLLPLSGKSLDVAGHKIRLGVPQVEGLTAAPNLFARTVTIKGFTEPTEFLEAANRKLTEMKIAGQTSIPLVADGPHAGKPRRRVLRIQGKQVVGFPLLITALTAKESVQLQEQGLGGRSKMGCGFFVPVKGGER